ncbi:hypothetical protein [Nonomuraea jabiensis]|uniref:Uncharacterized protein n=1 Tax=Nonomuraea jabiensis TaxID=882448 RepID=A0A7W9GG62_9ACTN|nr:hypothetical protein [Nonomuraea jabiensis]MBB5783157.1 hypothetical protein [Nonomuraea jabiensis]
MRWQIAQLGWDPIQGTLKTDASDREIAVDAETMAILKEHKFTRDAYTSVYPEAVAAAAEATAALLAAKVPSSASHRPARYRPQAEG